MEHATGTVPVAGPETRAEDLRRLHANDPSLTTVSWFCSGVGDTEVAQLALALAGISTANTACQRLDLDLNEGVTDTSASGLAGAVSRSGVVRVGLTGTGMGDASTASVRAACVANAERRLRANDSALIVVDWADAGVDDADVARLASALDGNSTCQLMHLELNDGVTQACVEGLAAALVKSAVVTVELGGTQVNESGCDTVRTACVANFERRLGFALLSAEDGAGAMEQA